MLRVSAECVLFWGGDIVKFVNRAQHWSWFPCRWHQPRAAASQQRARCRSDRRCNRGLSSQPANSSSSQTARCRIRGLVAAAESSSWIRKLVAGSKGSRELITAPERAPHRIRGLASAHRTPRRVRRRAFGFVAPPRQRGDFAAPERLFDTPEGSKLHKRTRAVWRQIRHSCPRMGTVLGVGDVCGSSN